MASRHLTDLAVKQAKPAIKPVKLGDGLGLFLLITPSGGKWWRFSYRYDAKQKTISLGTYPDTSLAKARDRCDAARRLVADGIDPSEQRRAAKSTKAEATANSFEAIAREWYSKAYTGKAESTRHQVMTRLEQDVFNKIGSKPISMIAAADVLATVEKIAERGALTVAKRSFNYIGRTLRYADSRGLVARDVSASIDIKLILTRRKTAHHAALTKPSDVGGLMRAIDGFTGSFVTVCALKLSAMTFVRPGELRHAEWSEIDLDNATWEIPGKKTKMRTDHIVPLSTQAVAVLRELQALTGRGAYVFPSERGGSRSMSENTINAALRRMGFTKEEMTAHGFRAAARTIMEEALDMRPDLLEHQLGHAVRDANGRAYNRTAHLPRRKEMMQVWADYLDKLKAGADVIPLRRPDAAA